MIDRIVSDIEADLYTAFESEVTSAQVGEIVMKHLAKLDEVSYIRFASVYREFNDAQDFVRAISDIAGIKVGIIGITPLTHPGSSRKISSKR